MNSQKIRKKYIGYILILLGIIISLKAFYVLYFILGMPVIWILYKEKKLQLLFYTIKDKLFYMFLILFLLVISVYFLNTGCLLYPVSFTCFDGLVWSIGSYETSIMNDHYQLWSKAGKTPNFNTEEPNLYLENFNWLNNWFNLYFFNKVSDFLVGIIFLSVLVIFIFYSGKKNFQKRKKVISM